MTSSVSSQQIPEWLTKHTSNSYVNAVYRILAEREGNRRLIRYTSQQSSPATPQSNTSSHYSVAIAYQLENQYQNRYRDVVPYDRTRVIVNTSNKESTESQKTDSQCKYLNASWVLERFGHKWWIATQAPLPNTAHTFLSIFLQPVSSPPKSLCPSSPSHPKTSRVRTVVQLAKDVENGRRKAHPYFPSEIGKTHVVSSDEGQTPALKVTLVNRRSIKDAHCIQSTVSIAPVQNRDNEDQENRDDDKQEAIIFQHMLYTSWPDHGVPDAKDRKSLLAFLQLVNSINRDALNNAELDPDPPIMIGCSAGIGRTGSFIAISSLLRAFGFLPAAGNPSPSSTLPPSPLGALPDMLHEDFVAQEVDSLREQRPGMVERNEQILLIYEILTSAFVQ